MVDGRWSFAKRDWWLREHRHRLQERSLSAVAIADPLPGLYRALSRSRRYTIRIPMPP